MGADQHVSSAMGEGATFTLTMPAADAVPVGSATAETGDSTTP
jgi:hypothetical protein